MPDVHRTLASLVSDQAFLADVFCRYGIDVDAHAYVMLASVADRKSVV